MPLGRDTPGRPAKPRPASQETCQDTETKPCGGRGVVAPAGPSRRFRAHSRCQNDNGDRTLSITVYSKPACVQCTATTRALDARGIAYSVIDLTEDAEAMEMVTGLGYRQAPVVVAGEAHWAGFRPDMIGRLA